MSTEHTSTCEHGNTIQFTVADGPLKPGSIERIDPPCCEEEEVPR